MEKHIQAWLSRDPDPDTREELVRLYKDNVSLAQALFGGRLEFGTAGLRAVLGAGPLRMNRLVVIETSSGLARYVEKAVTEAREKGIVIAYDGRRGSKQFAEDTAAVFIVAGFRVYLFDRETPTPVCAFAVQRLKTACGVVITASHNPPEYNGYKVYWENGAQIIAPHDQGIAAAIVEAALLPLPQIDFSVDRTSPLFFSVGDDLRRAYLDGLAEQRRFFKAPTGADLNVVYTPLHGVGAELAAAALAEAGFKNVHIVAEQKDPDGSFPSVRFPNPEEPGAMDLALALAGKINADIVCANDPDADRFAVAVRTDKRYRLLTGNEVGILLADFLLVHPPAHAVVATTIVSSRLLSILARDKKVDFFATLTGFKWIANGALHKEKKGAQFIFGYEEALGYTVGTLVRDKDGISAMMLFCALAQQCKNQGKTVLAQLQQLYRRYGLFVSGQQNLALSPESQGLGAALRRSRVWSIAGRAVFSCEDLDLGRRLFAGGRYEELDLPQSDVLVYNLDGDARVIVRPSGTEPKIKCYYELRENIGANEDYALAEKRAQEKLSHLIAAHQLELGAL